MKRLRVLIIVEKKWIPLQILGEFSMSRWHIPDLRGHLHKLAADSL